MILLKSAGRLSVLLSLMLNVASLKAQVPNLLNYQGKLTAAGSVVSDDFAMTFAIYSSADGGEPLWTEVQTITVTNGIFNALLGSASESGIPNSVFTGGSELYLGIKVDNDPEMTPRFRLASTAFAMRAGLADAVAANSITAGNIQDNAVSTPALATGAVTADKIAGGAITDASVNASAAIAGAKINPDFGAQNIVTTGNLGIGTVSPTAKLHISGTPGTDGIRFPDGSLQTTAASSGGGDFTLPVSESFGSSVDAFTITATGTGRAAQFVVDNEAHTLSAIRARSNGAFSSSAIFGINHGDGNAAAFAIQNSVNENVALTSMTDGGGSAGHFLITRDDNEAAAIYGSNNTSSGYAGYFDGRVTVEGALTASSKSFKIDHPQDPANKYLSHACVESSEMINIYTGTAALNAGGEATVILPAWFSALNRDFRYQLTAIGAPGPNLYIAEEISNNRFRIAGGAPGAKVSWQVTGVRQDAYANANPLEVEQEKTAAERGYYLNPEVHGQPAERTVYRANHHVASGGAANREQ